MKNIKIYIPLLCLLLACGQRAKEKQQETVVTEDSLDTYPPTPTKITKKEFRRYFSAAKGFFDSGLIRRGFNGSVLVAKDGVPVLEEYVGFTDPRQRRDSIRYDDAFHLASVSKTFTAMAILRLWQEGRLQLEDDLSKYFADFPYPGVTVKMLLNHRSGLPNYVHYFEKYGWDQKKYVSNLDVLSSLYTMHPPLQFPSGKRFAYCNTNYALLALIIEKVSGLKYNSFMQLTFFKPLEMKDTYVFSMKDTSRATHSFEWNNKEFNLEYLDLVYGDKNIYSTVRDMLKWDQALYAGRFFSQATLDSAFSPYSFEKRGKRNYGLGWRMTLLDNGKKLLYHNGWWHGNNTVFIRLVDEKATIIVLGNKFNRKIYSSKKLCDLFGPYEQNSPYEEEGESDISHPALGGSK